jgi:hypothetical protein
VATGSKSSSTVAMMSMVEVPGAARRSGRPAAEENHMGERWRLSTPPEVDAPGVTQRSGRPVAAGDHG